MIVATAIAVTIALVLVCVVCHELGRIADALEDLNRNLDSRESARLKVVK